MDKTVKRAIGFFLALGSFVISVNCQDCGRHFTCGECISEAGCAWCSEERFIGLRCQAAMETCSEGFIYNPSSSLERQTESIELNSPISSEEVVLNLRVGDPQTFTITLTPQRNLPLDLYILLDLSRSMTDELATVQSIASRIGDQISNVTANVRLGFGSFNEKIIQPFAFTPLEVTDPPFTMDPDNLPYAFRHTVSLTDDFEEFSRVVGQAEVTTNADLPENGLEGLAQVITCEDIIGWRPRDSGIGTRVILFMTDQEFHFAGEGRLAGILTPYDGECLLEANPDGGPVEFTRFNEFDYPSVGQILRLHQLYDVTTIFAIQEDHRASYQFLTDTILNSNAFRAVTAGFTVESAGISAENLILNLIETEYRRVLQSVSLDTSSITTDVTIEVVPSCPPESTEVGTLCEDVPLESSVNFTVTITLNSCEDLVHGQEIRQAVTSPSLGTFELIIIPQCNCGCAFMPGPRSECSDNGVPRCGVCECDEGRCGSTCSQVIGNRTSLDCPRGAISNLKCSGRGTCDCECICDQPNDTSQVIFGEACECDNFRCIQDDEGRVCSGQGLCCNGLCVCGTSPAGNRYRGEPEGADMCQCEPLEEVCMDPVTNEMCNSRGTCGCRFCICTDHGFVGHFCDIPNVPRCDYDVDVNCISTCRVAYPNEASLPSICTLCNTKRPLLFIDEDEISSVASDNRLLADVLVNLTNTILERNDFTFRRGGCFVEGVTAPCVTEYYVMNNETHFAVIAIRQEICPEAFRTSFVIPLWSLSILMVIGVFLLGIAGILITKTIIKLSSPGTSKVYPELVSKESSRSLTAPLLEAEDVEEIMVG